MTEPVNSRSHFSPEPFGVVSAEGPRPLSTASAIIGFCSLAFWFTFFAPLAGLILGIVGLRKEPSGRTLALVGIWTNAVMLAIAFLGLLVLAIVLSVGLAALPMMSGAGSSIGS